MSDKIQNTNMLHTCTGIMCKCLLLRRQQTLNRGGEGPRLLQHQIAVQVKGGRQMTGVVLLNRPTINQEKPNCICTLRLLRRIFDQLVHRNGQTERLGNERRFFAAAVVQTLHQIGAEGDRCFKSIILGQGTKVSDVVGLEAARHVGQAGDDLLTGLIRHGDDLIACVHHHYQRQKEDEEWVALLEVVVPHVYHHLK